ncbi:MAG: hypothetical protein Q9200_002640 [Gallowayella weberi]
MVASICSFIFDVWTDTSNVPLRHNIALRRPPFEQIDYHFWPSMKPGTALTPLKIEWTFLWILDRITEAQRWPIHVRAILHQFEGQQRTSIGRIDIDDESQPVKSVSSGSGAHNISELAYPQHPWRWLKCFIMAMVIGLQHFPNELVTDDPTFSPKPAVHRYSWSCRTPGTTDRIDFFIHPAANAGSPQQLSWRSWTGFLVIWIAKIANGEHHERSASLIRHGTLVAEISVLIQPGVGSDQPNGDVATA